MEIIATKFVTANPEILRVHCKVCDNFAAELIDKNGETLRDYEGYVPDFMPGQHYGDYIILDIDIESGMIKNWKVPTVKQMELFVKGKESD